MGKSSWPVLELPERPSPRPSPSSTRREEMPPRPSTPRRSTNQETSDGRTPPRLQEADSQDTKLTSKPSDKPRDLLTSNQEDSPSPTEISSPPSFNESIKTHLSLFN